MCCHGPVVAAVSHPIGALAVLGPFARCHDATAVPCLNAVQAARRATDRSKGTADEPGCARCRLGLAIRVFPFQSAAAELRLAGDRHLSAVGALALSDLAATSSAAHLSPLWRPLVAPWASRRAVRVIRARNPAAGLPLATSANCPAEHALRRRRGRGLFPAGDVRAHRADANSRGSGS